MVNVVALVGKITLFEKKESKYYFHLEVERPIKDEHGHITSAHIVCTLWRGIYETMQQYYRVGDVVSISGRLDHDDRLYLHVIVESIHVVSRGQIRAEHPQPFVE
jgi:single-stranded DNA-binding protein